MVAMPELPRRKCWPAHVVVGVRRSHDDRSGTRKLERDTLERRKTRRIEVLDHFDDRGRIEPSEPLVAVHERTVNELDARTLRGRHALQLEPIRGQLECPVRHVHPDYACELTVLEQKA